MFDDSLSCGPSALNFMKQTPEDLRFAGDFADALRPHVIAEKRNGRSLKQIAKGLGVTEPALKKVSQRPYAALP